MCRSGGCGDRHFQEYKLPIIFSRGAHARRKTTGSAERLYVENRSVRVRCCAASSYGGNEAGGGEGATTPMKTRPMATQQMCIKCVGARAAGLGVFGHSGPTYVFLVAECAHPSCAGLPALPAPSRVPSWGVSVSCRPCQAKKRCVGRCALRQAGVRDAIYTGTGGKRDGSSVVMKCNWRREMSKCTE